MINKIGSTDNKTSFGLNFVPDQYGYLQKLFLKTIENKEAYTKAINLMSSLRNRELGQELEIIEYGTLNGSRYVKIFNRNNGNVHEIEQLEKGNDSSSFLPHILERLELLSIAEGKFFKDSSPTVTLYKLLTGQTVKPITFIEKVMQRRLENL